MSPVRFSRRKFLGALAATSMVSPVSAAPSLGEDGMYYFDWYLQSFLDLSEDVATSVSGGKHLAIVWQQRACPFCKRMQRTWRVTWANTQTSSNSARARCTKSACC